MVVSLCLCSHLQLIAHKPMCVHKQKTRLARIRAVKSGGANAYLQYKRSRLIIDPEEEVTVDMQWWCCRLFSWFLIFSVSYPAVRSMLRAAFIVLSSVCVCVRFSSDMFLDQCNDKAVLSFQNSSLLH